MHAIGILGTFKIQCMVRGHLKNAKKKKNFLITLEVFNRLQ